MNIYYNFAFFYTHTHTCIHNDMSSINNRNTESACNRYEQWNGQQLQKKKLKTKARKKDGVTNHTLK